MANKNIRADVCSCVVIINMVDVCIHMSCKNENTLWTVNKIINSVSDNSEFKI